MLSLSLQTLLNDIQFRRILFAGSANDWVASDFKKIRDGDLALSRSFNGEETVVALQRLMVFLGYSTASDGAYLIDGDFGRGTNRGIAQFQLEHGIDSPATRETLCYECTFRNARRRIVAIPDVLVDSETLTAMLGSALESIEHGDVTSGDFEEATFHLDSLEQRRFLNCPQIAARYGEAADRAIEALRGEKNLEIRKEWILAIIKLETSGVIRPRLEQHQLSKANTREPELEFTELRLRSTSFGLGQVMGFNYRKVGADSARSMLRAPPDDQVLFVARFIARKPTLVVKANPTMADFRAMARYYNGAAFETHHYHERLEKWFNEFKAILN
jgi:hypothetical protein